MYETTRGSVYSAQATAAPAPALAISNAAPSVPIMNEWIGRINDIACRIEADLSALSQVAARFHGEGLVQKIVGERGQPAEDKATATQGPAPISEKLNDTLDRFNRASSVLSRARELMERIA